jgi:hypothetical protein
MAEPACTRCLPPSLTPVAPRTQAPDTRVYIGVRGSQSSLKNSIQFAPTANSGPRRHHSPIKFQVSGWLDTSLLVPGTDLTLAQDLPKRQLNATPRHRQ